MKKIAVLNPNNLPTIPYMNLEDLQGDLKTITKESIQKLQRSIIQNGIFVPKFVWISSDNLYFIVDGHQTKKALLGLEEKGYEVPEIPYAVVQAEDKIDALKKLLIINSRYGQYNLGSFMLEKLKIPKFVQIPELEMFEMSKFRREGFDIIYPNKLDNKELLQLEKVTPHPMNFRQYPNDQLNHIIEDIKSNGLYYNVLISHDGTILRGHNIVEAIKKMGKKEIPVIRLNIKPDSMRALKILINDNEFAHLAVVDDRALTELLKMVKEKGELLGTGFDEMMVASLAYITRPQSEIQDFDAAAEWLGMPEYEQGKDVPKLMVQFDTEKKRTEFVEKMEFTTMLKTTSKTWSVWWPEKPKDDRGSIRFEIEKSNDIKTKLMKNVKPPLDDVISKMFIRKKRPLAKLNPWAWWVEIVRGCNLKCDFCPTILFPDGELNFMDKDTWIALLTVMQEATPYCRLELCNAGEPMLHPDFLEYLSIAREIVPHIQLLTYTNGTQIINGKFTYKQLFDAGLNMVFLDMYAPFEKHKAIAEKSNYAWYHQDKKPKEMPSVFTYQNNPDFHLIMLAENPYNWSKRKLGRGYLQTFFNDLDWDKAKKYGLEPVTDPPARRCDLPNKFVNVNYDGTFIFCCFDYMRHTIDKFGNIKNGTEDFMKFWLGEYMQRTRKLLINKDRKSHEWCSKCRFTSIRCDIPYWPEETLNQYWTGEKWMGLKK